MSLDRCTVVQLCRAPAEGHRAMTAYAKPIFIGGDKTIHPTQVALRTSAPGSQFSEARLQALLFQHPDAIPVRDIAPSMQTLVPLCMELDTGDGFADILYLTPAGQIVLVETKLWRNPEARRTVVSQILDYAKQLTRWRYEDLDAAVAKASRQGAGYVLRAMRERYPELDEAEFVDAINRHLATGDLLLLIAGDGIRSSTEALVGFIEQYGSLRFSFGLIEVAIYEVGQGLFVQPRILAQTELIRRTLFIPQALPPGQTLGDAEQEAATVPVGGEADEPSPEVLAARRWYEEFWGDFLGRLRLDNASQPRPPKPATNTNQYFPMPPRGQAWLSVYLQAKAGFAGVKLAWLRDYELTGETYQALHASRADIEQEVGLPMIWSSSGDGRYAIEVRRPIGDLRDPTRREQALAFLTDATNRMVNALRGRIEALLAEQKPVN
jgi:hypothetical protein